MEKLIRQIKLVSLLAYTAFPVAASALALTPMNQSGPNPSIRAVVAVQLDSPDFVVREFKNKVLYAQTEVKHIPVGTYDFRSAFIDELLAALSEDKGISWRQSSAEDEIDVPAVWNNKVKLPPLEADRILLVDIKEYGAYLSNTIWHDTFHMNARFRLVDRATGKKLWQKELNERIRLEGKIAELQADNQKGLKEGINKVLEKLCAKLAADIRQAK